MSSLNALYRRIKILQEDNIKLKSIYSGLGEIVSTLQSGNGAIINSLKCNPGSIDNKDFTRSTVIKFTKNLNDKIETIISCRNSINSAISENETDIRNCYREIARIIEEQEKMNDGISNGRY